jgi:hypothetical protein
MLSISHAARARSLGGQINEHVPALERARAASATPAPPREPPAYSIPFRARQAGCNQLGSGRTVRTALTWLSCGLS